MLVVLIKSCTALLWLANDTSSIRYCCLFAFASLKVGRSCIDLNLGGDNCFQVFHSLCVIHFSKYSYRVISLEWLVNTICTLLAHATLVAVVIAALLVIHTRLALVVIRQLVLLVPRIRCELLLLFYGHTVILFCCIVPLVVEAIVPRVNIVIVPRIPPAG